VVPLEKLAPMPLEKLVQQWHHGATQLFGTMVPKSVSTPVALISDQRCQMCYFPPNSAIF